MQSFEPTSQFVVCCSRGHHFSRPPHSRNLIFLVWQFSSAFRKSDIFQVICVHRFFKKSQRPTFSSTQIFQEIANVGVRRCGGSGPGVGLCCVVVCLWSGSGVSTGRDSDNDTHDDMNSDRRRLFGGSAVDDGSLGVKGSLVVFTCVVVFVVVVVVVGIGTPTGRWRRLPRRRR